MTKPITAIWTQRSATLLLAFLASFCLSPRPAAALTLLSSNQLVFVNVDHAPMGACSTMAYGYHGEPCGVGWSSGVYPYWNTWNGGVLVALSGAPGLQLMPFVTNAIANARFFPDTNIQRSLTPCTDQYTVAGTGLSFTHYTPAWLMPDLNTATLAEKKRFFLPATWLVFTINNTNSSAEDFYFGLPVPVTQRTFASGAYQGFALGEAALAVQSGSCDLLSGAALSAVFPGINQGFAFHVRVPAGQSRTLMVVNAFYRSAVVDSRTGAHYYYTSLYPSIDAVIDAAFAGFGDATVRCQQLAAAMDNAHLNPYRHFLACHALHSYMAITACLLDPQGGVHWWEMEGWFNYINTFDLTVDHAFYDMLMHPWALRNVLDGFSGALPFTGYTYTTPLINPSGTQVSTQGFSFYHDMGGWPNSGTGPAYGAVMGDEELQSWILSAGMYWSHTADNVWLTNNLALLQTCLNSMLLRDNTNAAARDGITKNVNPAEITTWDDLDISLQRPAFSGRLAVRNWACYLALNAMFNQVGDTVDAATCETMAGTVAQTIVSRWATYQATLGYIPALLDGSSTAAIVSMVEGLAYPSAMGLTNALDRVGGPYANMLQALSNHLAAVLVPGRCLSSGCGAWLSTSATPTISWQSKNFICQYVAEAVLGITNDVVNGSVDQIHASLQLQDAPLQGFCDAINGTGTFQYAGGPHYPRGITTALWWLNATNNPAYPVAASAPGAPTISFALAGDRQVTLAWQGVPFATGYNVKRGTVSGGPYALAGNDLAGASFTDSIVTNGLTYYYILTATNQIGESAPSAEVSATPVPSAGTNIAASINATGVMISWPASYRGWILQTNTAGLGDPAGWGDVPGLLNQSQISFPTSNPAEFFRLRHP
ncbi:MAG TPA: glycoside hydrolase family 52 protein [Verrucomicrobiae bacterium]|nr:glycoside hydrolase family 52 protein [Verrucomicrobiae bacterium]